MQEKMKSSFLDHCSRFGIAFLSGTAVTSPGGPFDTAIDSSTTSAFDLKSVGIVFVTKGDCVVGKYSELVSELSKFDTTMCYPASSLFFSLTDAGVAAG